VGLVPISSVTRYTLMPASSGRRTLRLDQVRRICPENLIPALDRSAHRFD
jgi:hypothetical protein